MANTQDKNTKQQPQFKYISLEDFLKLGYLEALNTQYLMPRGFALQLLVSNNEKEVVFGGIWDYRHIEGGIEYPPDMPLSDEALAAMDTLYEQNKGKRIEKFGSPVQTSRNQSVPARKLSDPRPQKLRQS